MQETTELLRESVVDREPSDLSPGFVVADAYRVLERLGTGGMADVYEAEHVRLGNRVALKVLRTSERRQRLGVERFRHEARRVAALSSEHVVKVFDCGELSDATPFLVMERLWGEDLRSLLEREGPLPVRRAVELAIGACRGLSAVHAAGLVHRDLKPANLFVVRRSDGTDWCKILDFGVAKALVSDATASGTLLGTVRYMAPEQLEDAASARAAADVYAVGAILYESLTGTAPHAGETLQELMFSILHRELVPPSKLREIPPELEAVVIKALARDKANRYATAEAMVRALLPFGAVAPRQRVSERAGDDTLDEHLEARATFPTREKKPKRAMSLTLAFLMTLVVAVVVQGSMSKNRARSDALSSRPAPVAMPRAPSKMPEPVGTQEAPVEANAQVVRLDATPQPSVRKPRSAVKPRPSASAPPTRTDRFDSRDPYTE